MILVANLMRAIHLAWLALVIFGAIWTRGRPVWTVLHFLALVWGIVVELGPWPCPLTLAEGYFEARAGLPGPSGQLPAPLSRRDRLSQPTLVDRHSGRHRRVRAQSQHLRPAMAPRVRQLR